MKATIYGIKNCNTMKKAFAWLDEHGIDYVFHDYKKDGVPVERLKAWSARLGWEKLANSRGPTWRNIPDAEKANLTEARMLKVLERNSSAIRRPVIEAGAKLILGFDEGEYSKSLSSRP